MSVRECLNELVSNLKGVASRSPGLLYSATLGDRDKRPNPNGVAAERLHTPRAGANSTFRDGHFF
jgi:hypothetical protein